MLRPAITRQTKMSKRRPILSAKGARKIEPAAIPKRPELSNKPICAPESDHSADTDGAVKAITITSKPSIILRQIQIKMMNH